MNARFPSDIQSVVHTPFRVPIVLENLNVRARGWLDSEINPQHDVWGETV